MDMDDSFPVAPVRYAFDESDDEESGVNALGAAVKVAVHLDHHDATVLIVGVHGPGSVFLQSLTKEGERAGKVVSQRPDKPVEEIPIYGLDNAAYIAFDKSVADQDVAAFTKALVASFKSVVVLDSFIPQEYCSSSLEEHFPPFLRVLQTSSTKPIPDLVPYEPPNMIKGFAASLAAHCEMHAIPAHALLTLQESLLAKHLVTIETLQAYEQGLRALGMAMTVDASKVEHTAKDGRVGDNHHRLYL